MLKYLIIQLDDVSTSFCHYAPVSLEHRLIPLELLGQAVFWALKENLTSQVLYPDYELPEEYHRELGQIDHADIVSSECQDGELLKNADVVIFNGWAKVRDFDFRRGQIYTVRTSFDDFRQNTSTIELLLPSMDRLNIVFDDVDKLTKARLSEYEKILSRLSDAVMKEFLANHPVQFNLLTDRMVLRHMNNCNAGFESITLAPNGHFYVCPAFYVEKGEGVGNLTDGIAILNKQLYQPDHAPICKLCDAWHCKRCVWLNEKMTYEVNTPSHEQCVMAHAEREASRKLLDKIREYGEYMPEVEIEELSYNDPFELILNKL